MTDPRFYMWLFNMSDEIRDRGIPLLYNHVWDNYPVPTFNKSFYKSCDFIGCISKLTYDIVSQLGMKEHSKYIPHAVDANVFHPLPKEEILKHKALTLKENKDKFVLFYNSRNARRKMTSDVVKVFSYLLKVIGEDKAFLLMQTDPHDQEGADLIMLSQMLGLKPSSIAFSSQKVPQEQLNIFYNIADATINISNNEGFGLSCLESLTCGTPVIVNKTGGLQDQAIDDEGNELGVCIPPATRSCTGSQQIPWIYDDRNSDEDVLNAMLKLYRMSWDERKAIGAKGRAWSLKAFNMNDLITSWDDAFNKYVSLYRTNNTVNRIKLKKV